MTPVPQSDESPAPPLEYPARDRADDLDDPRQILRLRRCPQCDYDLRALPQRHRCPECGFEYDPTMFAVYGWPMRERLSAVGRLLMGTWWERALATVLLLFMFSIAGFQIYMFWRRGRYAGAVFVAFFAAAIVELVRLWPHARRTQEEQQGTVQLFFASNEVSFHRHGQNATMVPLERFARLHFRRNRSQKTGRDLWHVRLAYPWWHLTFRPIDALIECTQREAALVRGEIRRRMEAARDDDRP